MSQSIHSNTLRVAHALGSHEELVELGWSVRVAGPIVVVRDGAVECAVEVHPWEVLVASESGLSRIVTTSGWCARVAAKVRRAMS